MKQQTRRFGGLGALVGIFVLGGLFGGAWVGGFAIAEQKPLWHKRPASDPAPTIQVYDFSPLVERVRLAVINLSISGKAPEQTRYRPQRRRPWGGWPFDWGNPRNPNRTPGTPRDPNESEPRDYEEQQFFPFPRPFSIPRNSKGSGFLINADGYALTNHHVVRSGGKITAQLADGREFEAQVIGSSAELDVALIRLQTKVGERFPFAYLGDSDKAKVGEPVVAIGNARGLGSTVTQGIVSAKGRNIGTSLYDHYIQTDAAINFGNSGGPLFNRNGEVIGINTAILRNSTGIGFAVPINIVRKILLQLKTGKVQRAQLGVKIQAMNEALARSFGLERPKGALVVEVSPGSPADRAGIKVGDVVVSFNDQDVVTFSDLPRLVAFSPVGTKSKVGLLRRGKKVEVFVTLTKFGETATAEASPTPSEPPKKESLSEARRKAEERLGLGTGDVTAELRSEWQLPTSGGVRIASLKDSSVAEQNGLRQGDVILEVNRTPVKDVDHFAQLVGQVSKGDNILLLVHRKKSALFLAFPLP